VNLPYQSWFPLSFKAICHTKDAKYSLGKLMRDTHLEAVSREVASFSKLNQRHAIGTQEEAK